MRDMSLLENKLILARKEAGLSRTQVKTKTGIDVQSLYRYENGITIPKADKLKKLADLYKVPITFFFTNS
jgi:transcriptional regulator with XRE-family HTH domain